MSVITKNYKGFRIQYYESTEEWVYEEYRDKSLKALCARLDKDVKAGFTRQEVFVIRTNWNGPVTVHRATVTSTLSGGRRAWVSHTDREHSREQVELQYLYPMTPDNEELVNNIEISSDAAQSLLAEIDTLVTKLTPFKL